MMGGDPSMMMHMGASGGPWMGGAGGPGMVGGGGMPPPHMMGAGPMGGPGGPPGAMGPGGAMGAGPGDMSAMRQALVFKDCTLYPPPPSKLLLKVLYHEL